jgi:hypothetical protein
LNETEKIESKTKTENVEEEEEGEEQTAKNELAILPVLQRNNT